MFYRNMMFTKVLYVFDEVRFALGLKEIAETNWFVFLFVVVIDEPVEFSKVLMEVFPRS